ncbi:hypothetical protein AYI70_g2523 [Smittium culicis]|uniref:Uncharacterized protein n=1 Tax=Smittium culicis TaxID=133412 RepID=A0A1R1Y7Z0_9FUNG|nr:hypothetical protein AYI70_g2523 [Smittium culicis]
MNGGATRRRIVEASGGGNMSDGASGLRQRNNSSIKTTVESRQGSANPEPVKTNKTPKLNLLEEVLLLGLNDNEVTLSCPINNFYKNTYLNAFFFLI